MLTVMSGLDLFLISGTWEWMVWIQYGYGSSMLPCFTFMLLLHLVNRRSISLSLSLVALCFTITAFPCYLPALHYFPHLLSTNLCTHPCYLSEGPKRATRGGVNGSQQKI